MAAVRSVSASYASVYTTGIFPHCVDAMPTSHAENRSGGNGLCEGCDTLETQQKLRQGTPEFGNYGLICSCQVERFATRAE